MRTVDVQFAPSIDLAGLWYHADLLEKIRYLGVYQASLLGESDGHDAPRSLSRELAAGLVDHGACFSVECGAVKNEAPDHAYIYNLSKLKEWRGIAAVSMDEPIRYCDGVEEKELAKRIAHWIRVAHLQGYDVNWIEALPGAGWRNRIKPVLSRVWELEPFDQLTLDIDPVAVVNGSVSHDDLFHDWAVDAAGWVVDRRGDVRKSAMFLSLGATVVSPSWPIQRGTWPRLDYALRDQFGVGFRQAWSDGAYRRPATDREFEHSLDAQLDSLEHLPLNVVDVHSWERNPQAHWSQGDAYPRTVPSLDCHARLAKQVLRQ